MSARLVLASSSAVRARLLRNAGVAFDVVPSRVDEAPIKQRMLAEGAGGEAIAAALATAKALDVANRADGLVLGADQILRCDGELFDKAGSVAQARERLVRLRGREHELVGAVAFARGDAVVHAECVVSQLRMRSFTDAFLDAYLAQVGEQVLSSVGCYQFEDIGVQLFDRADGDYFAILGLPLMPVLEILRREGLVAD